MSNGPNTRDPGGSSESDVHARVAAGAPDSSAGDGEAPVDDSIAAAASAAATRAADAGPDPVLEGLALAVARRLPPRERDPDAIAEAVRHAVAVLEGRRGRQLHIAIDEHGVSGGGERISSRHGATTIDVNCPDGPYLLATALAELRRRDLAPAWVLHPVLGVARGPEGELRTVRPARSATTREAWLHLVLDRRLEVHERAEVATDLEEVLEDARAVGAAEGEMRDRVAGVARQLADAASDDGAPQASHELSALLDWLLAGRFALLGLVDAEGRRYGLAGRRIDLPPPPGDLSGPDALTVRRRPQVSSVLRRERLVEIATAGVRLVGLFEREAHADPVDVVPVARRRLAALIAAEDLVEGSHDERGLRGLFASLPLPEQLGREVGALRRDLVPLLALRERSGVAVRGRVGEDGDARVLATLPRERYSPAVRELLVAALVAELGGVGAEAHVSFGDASVGDAGGILLHFTVHAGSEPLAEPDLARLQELVRDGTRTWPDRVVAAAGEGEQQRVADWARLLPEGYRAETDPDEALADVRVLESLLSQPHPARVRFAVEPDGRVTARLYHRGEPIELSRLLPVVECLGFVVADERPHRVERAGQVWHLHRLGLRPATGGPAPEQVRAHADQADAAVVAALRGRTEPDELDRLVLTGGLRWDDIAVLRAYRRLRRQLGVGFTEAYQNAALTGYPDVARGLLDLLAARLHPEEPASSRAERVTAARENLDGALSEVERFDEDRILRGYAGLIEATNRTNRWRARDDVRLALKLDSAAAVRALGATPARTGPRVETFVYAPEVEGVHLRGGRIARGGVRHSDRREDVRAEVADLARAQQQKNAVIVPEGAKGGFVPKRDTPALDAYSMFVHALLDVTDNVEAGEVSPPADVHPSDGDDPYLVIAPDRGTATFSDSANAIALERGFWLGDAFASGGSTGFDHKRMGITARGAWVAVRRHLAALGIDVDRDPVTAVGIGDMSGDVFGNALLQSRAVRLLAAFDHRDIFLDPHADASEGYEARAELARQQRSSWQDLDRRALGSGGGVWSRASKAIPLSDEVREWLGFDAGSASPPELVRAILGAPVDLLFAGGVGTFVKASDERHSDVADRGNDGVRIDASHLRARVVGEGANLALTQRARVEYSRRGGRCHTDAIDNVAGVATSDVEVNTKILLDEGVATGRIDPEERDALLARAESEVAERVLADCDRQVRALAREVDASEGQLDAYASLAERLEGVGRLDRDADVLPDDDELARRRRAGAGLVRPELAVLHAASKQDLRAAVLASDLPDDPSLSGLRDDAFPATVRARVGSEDLERHRLARELVAARLSNELVDRMGPTWIDRVADELGVAPPLVARAWWIARGVLGAATLADELGALGADVDAGMVRAAERWLVDVTDRTARSYVADGRAADEALAGDLPVVEAVDRALSTAPGRRRVGAPWTRELPAPLVERLAAAGARELVPDVAAVTRDVGVDPVHVAATFAAAEAALPFQDVSSHLADAPREGVWVRRQRAGLADDLRRARRRVARVAVRLAPADPPEDAVRALLEARESLHERALEMVAALADEAPPSLDAIGVAVRALRDLATTGEGVARSG
ncbi:hypothetical protein ER308_01065 [Egibacter rhizosphaerae]|uniref:Uncharacterized protein n=1 Tax=Egibacter rhizosphaerae TaxID=1670831 RepID=A0A411YAU1_9ACTN|nr:NAD-glutamate dehydrogenase domain-containing protein [Egibacter rhizosphaerae]QBI18297.1 hypothetical protein ER308_01065 [Egibacter rhizosphaerae]